MEEKGARPILPLPRPLGLRGSADHHVLWNPWSPMEPTGTMRGLPRAIRERRWRQRLPASWHGWSTSPIPLSVVFVFNLAKMPAYWVEGPARDPEIYLSTQALPPFELSN